MKTLNVLVFSILSLLLFNCKEPKKAEVVKKEALPPEVVEIKETPISKIEKAHHKQHFLSKKAIEFDITVIFGGHEHISGKVTTLTNSSKALITLTTGDKIYVNKDKVQHTPNIKNEKMVRFDAYTWTYFFLFPYKLSDPGTHWSEFGTASLNGKTKNIQHLTFESGTGDAPDDWYYVYSNPENHLINAAAYIVSFGKTKEKAEEEPHAIKYDNYQSVEGIPFATEWTFWGWNKTDGLTQQIGEASIRNVNFVDIAGDFFVAPENYISK